MFCVVQILLLSITNKYSVLHCTIIKAHLFFSGIQRLRKWSATLPIPLSWSSCSVLYVYTMPMNSKKLHTVILQVIPVQKGTNISEVALKDVKFWNIRRVIARLYYITVTVIRPGLVFVMENINKETQFYGLGEACDDERTYLL